MDSFLIVQRGEDIGRRYDLDTVQLTIGRGADNDMVLNDPMVSRYHAVIKRSGNGYTIIDLGSSNPVVVNDQPLEAGMSQPLNHRDVVFIGKTVFSFQTRGETRGQHPSQAAQPQGAHAERSFTPPPPPPPPMERQPAQPPMTPTIETPLPPGFGAPGAGDQTMVGAPAGRRGPQDDDSDRTIVGGIRLGQPDEPKTPPPAPRFTPPPPPAAGDEEPTGQVRPPAGGVPPLPPLGAPPQAGAQGGPPPAPPSPPAGRPEIGRVVGTPPDEDNDDRPTVFIPRERH